MDPLIRRAFLLRLVLISLYILLRRRRQLDEEAARSRSINFYKQFDFSLDLYNDEGLKFLFR